MIHTTTTHSFSIDRKSTSPMMKSYSLARGYCYPQGDLFFLAIGGKEDVSITWEEWNQLSEAVKKLRATSQMEVILSAQGVPTDSSPQSSKGE